MLRNICTLHLFVSQSESTSLHLPENYKVMSSPLCQSGIEFHFLHQYISYMLVRESIAFIVVEEYIRTLFHLHSRKVPIQISISLSSYESEINILSRIDVIKWDNHTEDIINKKIKLFKNLKNSTLKTNLTLHFNKELQSVNQ